MWLNLFHMNNPDLPEEGLTQMSVAYQHPAGNMKHTIAMAHRGFINLTSNDTIIFSYISSSTVL